ncbi:putative Na+/H+ antiporter [Achromobacter sp. JD417]|uniref:putative Na+/H+ antiporter n=1 Tax=Achromobacter sp. JD417 TaxID=2893881 RepID=UPI0035A613C2
MTESGLQILAAIVFAIALLHTFSAPIFLRLAHRSKRHGGLLHLLGEVEVVFGFWAAILLILMALASSGSTALAYAESRNYTEPAFVFVVMVIAASLPVLTVVMRLVERVARALPVQDQTAKAWLCLALVPLAGSLVTEPAAMTIAAMMLAPQVFHRDMPERLKYLALGVLFVNISIGGTLTSYAAPPVLMVASTWGWDSAFMFTTFGWKAALAVLVNATLVTLLLRPYLRSGDVLSARKAAAPMSPVVIAVHLFFLAAVVFTAHHPIIFLALFLFFIGYTQAYKASQSPLIIKEALLVGFFLAGLVVLGGMQQWWLQPIVSGLEPNVLFVGALALTAITDNAALTYLGSLIDGISGQAQYMLVAGAVAGGGLTVIANAPNPAGVALLRGGFANGAVGMLGLLSGALVPTAIAAAFLFFL